MPFRLLSIAATGAVTTAVAALWGAGTASATTDSVPFGAPASTAEAVSQTPLDEPGNCDTDHDYGVWDSRADSEYVGGTWINCGSGWDVVYIEVNNASDGPCVYVAPHSAQHMSYNPLLWGVGNHTRTWRSCA
jgi:hypothetical protein